MSHFCKCGADEYICQQCGKINCSKETPSQWVEIPRMNDREGNMCPQCVTGLKARDATINAVLKKNYPRT